MDLISRFCLSSRWHSLRVQWSVLRRQLPLYITDQRYVHRIQSPMISALMPSGHEEHSRLTSTEYDLFGILRAPSFRTRGLCSSGYHWKMPKTKKLFFNLRFDWLSYLQDLSSALINLILYQKLEEALENSITAATNRQLLLRKVTFSLPLSSV